MFNKSVKLAKTVVLEDAETHAGRIKEKLQALVDECEKAVKQGYSVSIRQSSSYRGFIYFCGDTALTVSLDYSATARAKCSSSS